MGGGAGGGRTGSIELIAVSRDAELVKDQGQQIDRAQQTRFVLRRYGLVIAQRMTVPAEVSPPLIVSISISVSAIRTTIIEESSFTIFRLLLIL